MWLQSSTRDDAKGCRHWRQDATMRASERLDPISGGMSSNCRHRAHMQTSRKRKQQPSFRCSRKVRGEHDALTKAAGYAQATTESLGLDGSHLAAAFGEISWESSILDMVQQRRRIRVESLDRVCSSLVLLVIYERCCD